jgi:hypothetical protein
VSVTFTWKGFDELLDAFRTLPGDLTVEAGPPAVEQAKQAESEIRAAWDGHMLTGSMGAALRVVPVPALGPLSTGARVIDASPNALWFEEGTAARHTRKGYNRGAMRPAHVFVPALQRARAAFYGDVATLLEAHGLEVRR